MKVKTKTKKTLTVAALALTVSSLAFADGTRGGGQTVNVNGHPALRDLVDQTNCIWSRANDLAAVEPHFADILNNIGSANWYLRAAIETEMKNLNVCETNSALKSISVDDRDLVTVYAPMPGQQIAIRLNDSIYLDSRLYKQLTPTNRAYLLLHETMHSFIPMDAERRNTKLRSFVAAAHSLENVPMSQDRFTLQLTNNSISVGTGSILDHQADYLTMINKNAPQADREQAAMRLSGPQAEISGLTDGDTKIASDLVQSATNQAAQTVQNDQLLRRRAPQDLRCAVMAGDLPTVKRLVETYQLNPNIPLDAGYMKDCGSAQNFFFEAYQTMAWFENMKDRNGNFTSIQYRTADPLFSALNSAIARSDQAMVEYLLGFANTQLLADTFYLEGDSYLRSLTSSKFADLLGQTAIKAAIDQKLQSFRNTTR